MHIERLGMGRGVTGTNPLLIGAPAHGISCLRHKLGHRQLEPNLNSIIISQACPHGKELRILLIAHSLSFPVNVDREISHHGWNARQTAQVSANAHRPGDSCRGFRGNLPSFKWPSSPENLKEIGRSDRVCRQVSREQGSGSVGKAWGTRELSSLWRRL